MEILNAPLGEAHLPGTLMQLCTNPAQGLVIREYGNLAESSTFRKAVLTS